MMVRLTHGGHVRDEERVRKKRAIIAESFISFSGYQKALPTESRFTETTSSQRRKREKEQRCANK